MKTLEEMYNSIIKLHQAEYESRPELIVSAPGVLRILGEHIAMAEGMSASIPLSYRLSIAISSRRDNSLRFHASNLNERKRTNLANLKYRREDRWANAFKAALLYYFGESSLQKGFNISIAGDIPMSLGLGSSSALTAVSARAAAILASAPDDNKSIAQAAGSINSSYFENPIDDRIYMSTIYAKNNSMLFMDHESNTASNIDFRSGKYCLLLTDSRVPRIPLGQEMAEREANYRNGLSLLGGKKARNLRSFSVQDLEDLMGRMPEQVRRQCNFYIDEVQRVKEAALAVKAKDLHALGKILSKSQMGLRNFLEVSCPEIDWLVKRAMELDGVLCSRMTGQGFGGCTISIMPQEAIPEYSKRLEEYERIFGFKASSWIVETGQAMSLARDI